MVLYLLFLLSGLSGLIYQVVWVRVFGNVFGNTVYSASVVVGVFMLGLGAGSYAVGAWADRRYADAPETLLRAYAWVELLIGTLAFGISLLLPHLGPLSALVSSYSREASGWYALSTGSYLARTAFVVLLLAPITLLMGGTLTLLIRHLVRRDVHATGWRIAVLYGVNTVGAALGCFVTDLTLVPRYGLRATQALAVLLNLVAAGGAFYLWRRLDATTVDAASTPQPAPRGATRRSRAGRPAPIGIADVGDHAGAALMATATALAMSGFAAMGMEIVWFRHFTILLGGFRAVFSLLLTVVLVGIGAGSLLSGFVCRRTERPAEWWMGVQSLFAVFTLAGLAIADARHLETLVAADAAAEALRGAGASGLAFGLTDLWFNARSIVVEVGVPALLMGFAFPLANAIAQRQERSVGRHAGVLYLANTAGAVCGSVAAGFLFLPLLGIQRTATVLVIVAALAVLPLRSAAEMRGRTRRRALAGSLLAGCGAIAVWLLLPPDYVISRALPAPGDRERILARSEGLTEVISVVDHPGNGRTLVTNGHPMSSTARFSQRYMRALAHIPLLSMDHPETVLVIGFGVGNTTHAATLHPSVKRVDVADLSRGILAHASYFAAANQRVLADPRVAVYINDGRHHLQMEPPGSYDLITLEPPPIAYAGVAALYSREFYALARTRLKPGGYMSQWLPAYQVPPATTLAMLRAFVDVFPNAVLLSGAQADLIVMGTNGPRIEIDPGRVAAALAGAPAVRTDLARVDLASVREIAGMFLASPQRLAAATRASVPVSDDRPLTEYPPASAVGTGTVVPASVVDLSQVASWCPRCFVDGRPAALADGLDTYLGLLDRAYMALPGEAMRARVLAERDGRLVLGSAYLGALVPETADVHDYLGVAHAGKGRLDEAIAEFRRALALDPSSAVVWWHLGNALAARGSIADATGHLRRAVALDPSNARARTDLASLLIDAREFGAAAEQSRAALSLTPDSAVAHNRLAIALAGQGRLDEAIDQFERALALDPGSETTRRNLELARQQRRLK